MKVNEIERYICLVLDERKNYIPYFEKVARYYNIQMEFWISGNKNDPEFTYHHIDNSDNININKMTMHRKVFEKLKKDKNDHVFITEDDATFTRDWVEILDEIKWPEKYHNINFGQQFIGLVDDQKQLVIKDITEMNFLNHDGKLIDFLVELRNKTNHHELTHNPRYINDPIRTFDKYPEYTKITQPCLVRGNRMWGFAGTILHNSTFDLMINSNNDTHLDSVIHRYLNGQECWHNNIDYSKVGNYSYIIFPHIQQERLLPEFCNQAAHIRVPFLWAQHTGRLLEFGEDFRGI